MRARIVDHVCRDAPLEMAAKAQALIGKRGNIAQQLVEAGFAPGKVLEACCTASGLPPCPLSWLRDPKPPHVDNLDSELCRQLACAPVASQAGRLCIAYADPEMAAQSDALGLPPHQPYLALKGQLEKALMLLPEGDAFGSESTRAMPTDELFAGPPPTVVVAPQTFTPSTPAASSSSRPQRRPAGLLLDDDNDALAAAKAALADDPSEVLSFDQVAAKFVDNNLDDATAALNAVPAGDDIANDRTLERGLARPSQEGKALSKPLPKFNLTAADPDIGLDDPTRAIEALSPSSTPPVVSDVTKASPPKASSSSSSSGKTAAASSGKASASSSGKAASASSSGKAARASSTASSSGKALSVDRVAAAEAAAIEAAAIEEAQAERPRGPPPSRKAATSPAMRPTRVEPIPVEPIPVDAMDASTVGAKAVGAKGVGAKAVGAKAEAKSARDDVAHNPVAMNLEDLLAPIPEPEPVADPFGHTKKRAKADDAVVPVAAGTVKTSGRSSSSMSAPPTPPPQELAPWAQFASPQQREDEAVDRAVSERATERAAEQRSSPGSGRVERPFERSERSAPPPSSSSSSSMPPRMQDDAREMSGASRRRAGLQVTRFDGAAAAAVAAQQRSDSEGSMPSRRPDSEGSMPSRRPDSNSNSDGSMASRRDVDGASSSPGRRDPEGSLPTRRPSMAQMADLDPVMPVPDPPKQRGALEPSGKNAKAGGLGKDGAQKPGRSATSGTRPAFSIPGIPDEEPLQKAAPPTLKQRAPLLAGAAAVVIIVAVVAYKTLLPAETPPVPPPVVVDVPVVPGPANGPDKKAQQPQQPQQPPVGGHPPPLTPGPPIAVVGAGGDVNARQAALVEKAKAEKIDKQAMIFLSQAIMLNTNAPGARDAFLERARRALASGDLRTADQDLSTLRRRADAESISSAIEGLMTELAAKKKQQLEQQQGAK